LFLLAWGYRLSISFGGDRRLAIALLPLMASTIDAFLEPETGIATGARRHAWPRSRASFSAILLLVLA
jgi:hypothetical protein